MKYRPIYKKPYPEGWKNLPEEKTPISAEVFDGIDEVIEHVEKQLAETTGKYDTDNEGRCLLTGKEMILYGGNDSKPKILAEIDTDGNAVFYGNVMDGRGDSIAGLKALLQKVQEFAENVSSAQVFETREALETWIAEESNTVRLKSGQILLVAEKGVPDYWWSGTMLTELEGRREYTPDGTSITVDEDGTLHAVMIGNINDIWYPSVSKEGVLTWQRSASMGEPAAVNIKGEPGGTYSEKDKAELEKYIDMKFTELTGEVLGGAS